MLSEKLLRELKEKPWTGRKKLQNMSDERFVSKIYNRPLLNNKIQITELKMDKRI